MAYVTCQENRSKSWDQLWQMNSHGIHDMSGRPLQILSSNNREVSAGVTECKVGRNCHITTTILGHAAVANERSATVARRDGRTSSRLEVDDRRRPLARRHISDIAQFFSEILRCCATQSSVDED